jgi:hypothetical protein
MSDYLIIEKELVGYNKNILTISSSALVLFFTALQITNLHISKTLAIYSWFFIFFSLILSIVIYFSVYFVHLNELGADTVIRKIKALKKGFLNENLENFTDSEIQKRYDDVTKLMTGMNIMWKSRSVFSFALICSVFELFSLLLGLLIMAVSLIMALS